MKQVLCINDKGVWWSDITLTQTVGPAYLEICTVLSEDLHKNSQVGYVLDGYGEESFYAGLFIPLSEPSSTFEEEMELAEVNQCLQAL